MERISTAVPSLAGDRPGNHGPARPLLGRPAPLVGAALALLAWWLLTHPALVDRPFLAEFAPGPALRSLVRLLLDGTLPAHAWLSLGRALSGLAIAIMIGVPLGLLTGYLRWLDRGLAPVLQFLRTVSPLAWMPIAVIVLGVGDPAVVFLVAVAALWPILLNTAAGVRNIEPNWLLLAHSVGARGLAVLLHVGLPAVLPQLLSGIRIAVGLAWVVLVPAEMLGVSSGLGYFLLDTRDR
ncbi:MAG TPA: ABC transporter permease, partial [Bacillota bacterium]